MKCYLDYADIPGDLGILYGMMTGEDQYLYSTKIHFSTRSDFERWFLGRLGHDFHDFYLIKEHGENRILGYVYNYDFSLITRHCKLVVYILPDHRETGIGGMAACQYMDRLFRDYPLKKIYTTIYSYNKESLGGNLAAGFVVEGILSDYRYYDGEYHSLYYLSMTREKFESTIGKLVKKCSV